MNYIGSKLSLLPFIHKNITKVAGEFQTFADLFAGTGTVSAKFKREGYKVFANDIQYYSYVLLRHKIANCKQLEFTSLAKEIPELLDTSVELRGNVVCHYLMNLQSKPGFIFKNYCLGATCNTKCPRQYFSDYNGIALDTIRTQIEDWWSKRMLTEDECYTLLCSLLESADRYANTTSVYGSFLKELKKSAKEPMILSPAEPILSPESHSVSIGRANEEAVSINADVVYLDPPYNGQQYGVNYHLLETLARYDNPDISGKCGVRMDALRSEYSNKSTVISAFEDLINNINAKYVFLSYNNEGLMSLGDIAGIMSGVGEYDYTTTRNGRYKSDSDENRAYKSVKTTEYLHWVEVRK